MAKTQTPNALRSFNIQFGGPKFSFNISWEHGASTGTIIAERVTGRRKEKLFAVFTYTRTSPRSIHGGNFHLRCTKAFAETMLKQLKGVNIADYGQWMVDACRVALAAAIDDPIKPTPHRIDIPGGIGFTVTGSIVP